ncbi:MAG: hypothetical protein C5B50_10165 [Verrucomicrobia bacterium]|nr:MAG: hypothetical protein C5B50_10165 [Verrucomicrobiota bacterium]
MTVVEAQKPEQVAPKPCPLTVEAYHALGEMGFLPKKTELLYGQVFHKMAKSPLHTLIQILLLEALRKISLSGMHIRQDQPITCPHSEPEPDLAVVRGSIEDYSKEHPRTAELVIEVCITSHDYDRDKLRAYAMADVKEAWLILVPEKQVEVHRLPSGERFRERIVHGPGGRVVSSSLPQFGVDLDAFFAAAPK